MLPQWNKAVSLRIGSRCVHAAVSHGWRRGRTATVARRLLDSSRLDPTDPGKSGWALWAKARATEEVLAELAEATPLKGAALRVELSGPEVHLDVIEGDFVRSSDRQLRQIATACVEELLEDSAAECELRWQLQADDRHLLVCAIPRAGRVALDEATATHGLRMASLQCDFVTRWNHHARELVAGPTAFAVLTGQDLAIAWVVKGVIHGISVATVCRPPIRKGDVRDVASTPAGPNAAMGSIALAEGGAALDAQVDRLLSAIGQDPQGPVTYVLAADQTQPLAVSDRWLVLGRPEARP